jgi:hypothetical protein
MASTEEKAYEIMRELDVDYVLVIFGGMVGYSSDGKLFFLIQSSYYFCKFKSKNTKKISINFYGWLELVVQLNSALTSKKQTTILNKVNLELTKKAHQHSLIV